MSASSASHEGRDRRRHGKTEIRQLLTTRSTGYGVVTDHGLINLSARYPKKWPSLREVIADRALERLTEEADRLEADLPFEEFRYEIPIPAPEKIICVGINFPDRNEEYNDGRAAPLRSSSAFRARSPATAKR
jgi:2-keto-4-pentenoate hydratase/2-oxohepta-3-ene-1,7-dioic acid hydratase in catechol pathway